MILLDSNILIYCYQERYGSLRDYIFDAENIPGISAITILEVLGYVNISQDEEVYYNTALTLSSLFSIDSKVIELATQLKQQKKMSIGDSIIAATALINNRTLFTRNTKDFKYINGLKLENPIK